MALRNEVILTDIADRHDHVRVNRLCQGDHGGDLAACTALGGMHSEFGRILFTKGLNGHSPYLDPLEPIAREHIEQAAERVGIASADIDAQVASLSAHLGWAITRGLRLPDEKPG